MRKRKTWIPKECATCKILYDRMPKHSDFLWGKSRFCSNKCRFEDPALKIRMREIGKKPSVWNAEQRLQISLRQRGEKSHFWKGGITPKNIWIRSTAEYKNWRTRVFERDNYTCIKCKNFCHSGNPVALQAHHVRSFSLFPELRFDINNGETLCKECYKTVGSNLAKAKKYLKDLGYVVEREPICKENGLIVYKPL